VYRPNLHPGLEALKQDFPFLVDATIAYAVGDVWGRTGLDDKTRQLASIAAFAALGNDAYPQMRMHAIFALNLGATPEELKEIIYLVTIAAGFPRALNASVVIKEVLEHHLHEGKAR
jgi:4-carboxymuconolactone decarboxylase